MPKMLPALRGLARAHTAGTSAVQGTNLRGAQALEGLGCTGGVALHGSIALAQTHQEHRHHHTNSYYKWIFIAWW